MENLPSEILLIVLSKTPHSALTALSRTCRRLNKIVTPLLYQSVLLWNSHEWEIPTISLTAEQDPLPTSATRIWDISAFANTMRSSLSLRSYVDHVDLRWGYYVVPRDEETRDCLQALESLHLSTLHLSPPKFLFELPTQPLVTSLAIQIDGAREGRTGDMEPMLAFARLYSLMSIPSLTHFKIAGCGDWNSWPRSIPIAGIVADRIGTSNIQSLTIGQPSTVQECLEEVVRWPKSLKSLNFSSSSRHGINFWTIIYSDVLRRILQIHQKTLERIVVYVERVACSSNPLQPINLRNFPVLKTVKIRADFLAISLSDPQRERIKARSPRLCIGDVLPPSLEHLVLDFRQLFVDKDEYQRGPLRDRYKDDWLRNVWELMDSLWEIANVKATAFPKLRTLGFFHPDTLLLEEGQIYYERWREVKNLFCTVGVELTAGHHLRGREPEP